MKRLLIIGLAVLSMLFWASSFVWFKIVFLYYKPVTVVILRLLISFILLALYTLITQRKERVKKEDYKIFALLAFAEPFCYFLGESYGMQYVSASLGSIIISTIPLVTPLVALAFLKEKISVYGIIGLFVSFFGVIFIVSTDLNKDFSGKGIMLMFFAVISATFYGVILKKVTHKYSSITIVRTQNLIGMLYFLPIFLTTEYSHFLSIVPNKELIYTMLKLSVFGSTLALIFFTQVIRKIGLSMANIFTNLIPVFTAVIAYYVLDEKITQHKLLGILIVMAGLFIAQIGDIIMHIKRKTVSIYQG